MLPKEDILDMVWYRILKPVEKSNYPNSWKFKRGDITFDVYKRLSLSREKKYQNIFNKFLAEDIEDEWGRYKKNPKDLFCPKCEKSVKSLYPAYKTSVCVECL